MYRIWLARALSVSLLANLVAVAVSPAFAADKPSSSTGKTGASAGTTVTSGATAGTTPGASADAATRAKTSRAKPAASEASDLPPSAARSPVKWQSWKHNIFELAKKEKKLVILDLEAVWCHWCHVMDDQTYANGRVAKILNSHFIPVKVDQDARPDLSNKYEEYGWPATIIFDWNGKELVKRSGYIAPKDMIALLEAVVKDPTPGPSAGKADAEVSFSTEGALSRELRDELLSRHVKFYDPVNKGWGDTQKFLDWDTVEYAMARARYASDADSEKRARETLAAQRKIFDQVWGGVYQYSTHGDWEHPHFEKIMSMQAEDMRIYALAYSLWKDADYLAAAESIAKYLKDFLTSPEGAFYTSQDADLVPGEHAGDYFALDDKARRSKGIPRVDSHIYARENGWAINALAYLYMASGKKEYLDRATKAAEWIVANRSLPESGGFLHDARDKAGPFLGDTLAMGRAFLSLYQATADRKWLSRAEECGTFIDGNFIIGQAGFVTARPTPGAVLQPDPLLDENVMAARFFNLLHEYSGNSEFKQAASRAMKYLATPEIANKRRFLVGGILLADLEMNAPPTHITIIGAKDDPNARELFETALKVPRTFRRIDWWDRREGPLPNLSVGFPELKMAAAFVCSGGRCSSPIYKPDQMVVVLERVDKR